MAISRIPIATSLYPVGANGSLIVDAQATTNCIFTKYPEGKLFASQRYPINIFQYTTQPGSGTASSKGAGRGIYYWNFSIAGVSSDYTVIVNYDTIYYNSYSTAAIKTISTGIDPVYFYEQGNYLIILDPQNNNGWYIDKATVGTVTNLNTTVTWPFTPSRKMAGGGAVLNGILYIMDTDGKIWNSGANTPTTWNGIDFIEASRSTDSGVFLCSQHDQIVAISSKTIEFFYDAGNPVGSPLERRQDLFFNTGCSDRRRVFDSGDTIFFLGAERTGTISAWIIQDFALTDVSDDSMDVFFNTVISNSPAEFLVSGATVAGRKLFFVTSAVKELPGLAGFGSSFSSGFSTGFGSSLNITYDVWVPSSTIAYDLNGGYWSQYTCGALSTINNIADYPVISTSENGIGLRGALGIMTNGDVFQYNLTGLYQDTIGASGTYVDPSPSSTNQTLNYMTNPDDYVFDISSSGSAPINFNVFTPEYDGDVYPYKYLFRMNLVGDTLKLATNLTPIQVSWSDDGYSTLSTPRDLATGLRRSLTRLGNFKRRAFNLSYSGTDKLQIEGIEIDTRESGYA